MCYLPTPGATVQAGIEPSFNPYQLYNTATSRFTLSRHQHTVKRGESYMAHQAHNIPWSILASNLHWRPVNRCLLEANNFHFRFKPSQGKELNYFVVAFVRNIHNHAASETAGYSPQHQDSEPDAVVLSDAVAKRVAPTVRRWRDEHRWTWPVYGDGDMSIGLCPHQDPNDFCACAVPYWSRKVAAFKLYSETHCQDFLDFNDNAFFAIEVVKTLLMCGEMDTVLQICAHPDVKLAKWWNPPCYCCGGVIGWQWICKFALDAYILLNVIQCFPKTWESHERGGESMLDYRCTRAYQYMIYRLTSGIRASEVTTYPHRQFFGIQKDTFRQQQVRDNGMWSLSDQKSYGDTCGILFGRVSFDHFLHCGRLPSTPVSHLPNNFDVWFVRWMLLQKNLPLEIADIILQHASYTAQRRLVVEHDPFHHDNLDELTKYIRYCWQLLVRCEVLARALNTKLPWEDMIVLSLGELFNCECGSTETNWLMKRDYDESDVGTLKFC